MKEKEIAFWKRMSKLHTKFNIVGKILVYPLIFVIVVFGHYMFASMTLLHKFYLKISR